jgi:hypothetical protein
MIARTMLAGVAIFLFATPVLASPDLEVDIAPPPLVYAYEYTDYEIAVTNVGSNDVVGITLSIDLPETDTPQVEVLGIVGDMDPRCTASGTQIVCSLGTIGAGKTEYPWFVLALPWANGVLDVTATATSSAADTTAASNTDTEVGAPAYYDVQVLPGLAPTDACLPVWPHGYSSYFECTIQPGLSMYGYWSIAANGDIWLDDVPGVVGSWWQPASNRLVYTYDHGSAIHGVEQFEGWGTSPRCFEGLSSYSVSGVTHPRTICF